MKKLKFRQRLDGQFHFWGMIDGKFIAPASSSSGENPFTSTHDQYTGLKDKNGREIYEGDIIKGDNGYVGRIEFLRGAFVFIETNGFYNHLENLGTDECDEIIGNIYENPGL